jgi:two-component system phosphate regulon sensor histidine kinase PhoR
LRWCNQKAQQLLNIDRWQSHQWRLVLELVRSYELDRLIENTRQQQQSLIEEWFFYPPPESLENHQPSIALSSRRLKGYSFPLPQQQVVVILEDLQALAELSRSRDRAFSDLTHELRTPLTAISLVAETLEKRLQNPEREWVEQMIAETQRLQYLVENWLNLTAIQENPQHFLQYQAVELRELIFSSWQRFQPFLARKPVRWHYQGPEAAILKADPDRLMQVFVNLFDNSLKHSPPDGLIEVQVQYLEAEALWEIQIRDQGKGFAEADLPHIFERLYRGEVSRTRQGLVRERQGSGLGLAIAKEIVEAHGGTLTAQNSPLTGGACLILQIPSRKI